MSAYESMAHCLAGLLNQRHALKSISSIDISKQGLGLIVQTELTADKTYQLVNTANERTELHLVWIDYDSHELRYRCGLRAADEKVDLEAFIR